MGMKLIPVYNCYVLYLLAQISFWSVSGNEKKQFSDFKELPPYQIPQDVNEVHLPAKCPKYGRVTNSIFTFEPSKTVNKHKVEVYTYPSNLVRVVKKGRHRLQIIWNPDVAYNVQEGGVRIVFP